MRACSSDSDSEMDSFVGKEGDEQADASAATQDVAAALQSIQEQLFAIRQLVKRNIDDA